MKKKTLRATALAAVAGCLFQFGGCLGDSWWGRMLWDGVIYAGYEFVLDNDGVYDLWEDGGVAAE